MSKYTVIVATRTGEYSVKCKNKQDLDSYLKALQNNEPYFHLVKVKTTY